MQDPAYMALQATPFLECFGDLITAWGLCQQALVADAALNQIYAQNGASSVTDKRKLCQDNLEAKFYYGKIQTAQFFCNYVLPQGKGRIEAMKTQDRSALDMIF
jgi:hypothetical protein